MSERQPDGCDNCRTEWGRWRADHKRVFVERVASSATTGDQLFRCNDCGQWWSYYVLDDRPRPRTAAEAALRLAEIEATP